jgi:hypothetical protein
MDWLNLAASPGILQERLKESPQNPMLLRLEQDVAGPAERVLVCQRHAALLAAHDDADLRYVVDRCLEPPSARDAAFLEHYRESPKNPWLALAAGYTLADRDHWADAARTLDFARQALPEAAEFVAMQMARIKRLSEGEATSLKSLAPDSQSLRELLQLESGEGLSGPLLAYSALAQGKLDEALKLAESSPRVKADISLLVACSDGANAGLVSKVLDERKTQNPSPGEAWYLFALALRSKRDASIYRAVLVKNSPQYQGLIDGFETLVRSKPGNLENSMAGLQFSQRAYIYAAGVIVLGDRAPEKWREHARRLLFPAERPFFGLGTVKLSLE